MEVASGLINLTGLGLTAGEGRRLPFSVAAPEFRLGGVDYSASPDPLAGELQVSRTVGEGWALRIVFGAELVGPCSRCLEPASLRLEIDSREVDRPGGGDEMTSPYVDEGDLDVAAWVNDALLLALPPAILCEQGCKGLCDTCGERLADLPADHAHERPPDPRWDALRRLSG